MRAQTHELPPRQALLQQALVLGAPGDTSAALAAGLARRGVNAEAVPYADAGLRTRLLRSRPDLVLAVALTLPAERAAHMALSPVLEGLRALAVPVLAAVGDRPALTGDLLAAVDDVVLPPHHAAETLLRAALAAQRRGNAGATLIGAGALTVDVEGFRVWLAGTTISLTYTEFQLVRLLLLNRGKVLTRQMLLNKIWGYDYLGGLRTVDVHIRRLRAKIEGEAPHLIETVRHAGYRIAE